MLLPRIWDEDLFENMDNWMSWPDESEFFGKKNPLYGKHAKNLMKTDVRETEDAYEVDIDLPGFKKDEVTITVENGYLNISAVKGLDKDETDKKTGSTFVRSVTQAAAPEHFMSAKPLNPRMFPRSLKTVSCSFTF